MVEPKKPGPVPVATLRKNRAKPEMAPQTAAPPQLRGPVRPEEVAADAAVGSAEPRNQLAGAIQTVAVADDPNLEFKIDQEVGSRADDVRIDDAGEAIGPGRRRRNMGTRAPRLGAEQRPGYHRHWFKDTPGRIDHVKECGYEHVRDADGKPRSRVTGTLERGGGETCYLMEIPQEWYNEDFAAKQGALDETDRTIYRGKYKNSPEDKMYVPKGAMSMRVTTR